MGHVGCQSDVLSTADRRCSGRTSCEIRVPDAELEKTGPCLRELKTYLEITYSCLAGKLNKGQSPLHTFSRRLHVDVEVANFFFSCVLCPKAGSDDDGATGPVFSSSLQLLVTDLLVLLLHE